MKPPHPKIARTAIYQAFYGCNNSGMPDFNRFLKKCTDRSFFNNTSRNAGSKCVTMVINRVDTVSKCIFRCPETQYGSRFTRIRV
ncbi:MAG: hypothetical protein A2X22_05225 [Bacteroidetes bacterium GWF2_49_14]|nr:MAG: hypothetical protein A2X22_05225 [Bacteroidetes bacterium GWF2_49_14]HBB90715.1 hypothetical protein [Bacteroidales bacterium]